MSHTTLLAQLEAQRKYYQSGATRSATFRKKQLQNLKKAVLQKEEELYTALYNDLKKSKEECWATEIGFFLAELHATLKHLDAWMEPERKPTNLLNLPSTCEVVREPLGTVLIIAPWNYPFQLLFTPLLGAIAAGNTIVLKPSEFAPATAAIMKEIIAEHFSPEYILYVEGAGADVIPQMMESFTFDHVFYTGSTQVGKIIYQMAAKRLVPVTLELGGKSPCVVEADALLEVAARRILTPKFSNCGQMCVAPDYVLVHESVKQSLIHQMKKVIQKFFGDDPSQSSEYGKIINEKQFDRLIAYLENGTIIHGGRHNRDALYIEPTLLDAVALDSPVMQEEIFGPILPIIEFTNSDEAKQIIARHPNPLAFYVFSGSNSKAQEWIDQIPFGGGCVNNASWHLTNHNLPFGGRGFSGTGKYHGKYSFDVFSHEKAIMRTPTWFDPAMKYPPFKGKLKLFKWLIR